MINNIYKMELSEMIWIASVAFAKNYEFEKLRYSDYMYGKEDFTDEVWKYVEELNDFGRVAFYEKYKEYKLH